MRRYIFPALAAILLIVYTMSVTAVLATVPGTCSVWYAEKIQSLDKVEWKRADDGQPTEGNGPFPTRPTHLTHPQHGLKPVDTIFDTERRDGSLRYWQFKVTEESVPCDTTTTTQITTSSTSTTGVPPTTSSTTPSSTTTTTTVTVPPSSSTTTTTTVTTTVAPTTTVATESTTTIASPSSTTTQPTSTTEASVSPTTTTVPTDPELPATGAGTIVYAIIAVICLLFGGWLVLVTRTPK